MMKADCPNIGEHTPAPAHYGCWHAWAQEMTDRGARQVRCRDCCRYAIWHEPEPVCRQCGQDLAPAHTCL